METPLDWAGLFVKNVPLVWLDDRGVSQSVITDEADLPITIEVRRREHSRKNDEAYAAPERSYGEVRRLETLARRERRGWTTWATKLYHGHPQAEPELGSAVP
jgi:N6-adenosine-specific RNA methylase IME4